MNRITARLEQACMRCGGPIRPGMVIALGARGWQHTDCAVMQRPHNRR